MAATYVDGIDGNVTMPSSHGGIAFSWDLAVAMRTKDVTAWPNTNRLSTWRGGLMDVTGNIGCFLQANAASTPPGLANLEIAGVAITLLAKTGCSYGGTALFTDGRIGDRVSEIAVEVTYSLRINSLVETWAIV